MAWQHQEAYELFQWTEKEYTLKELIERFGRFLPFIIDVTQGYMGRDEGIHAETSDEVSLYPHEVYWLHDITRQPRIVAKDLSNKYYTIPLTYRAKVQPIRNSRPDGPIMTLQELLDGTWNYFDFQDQESFSVYSGAEEGNLTRLGRLEIMDTYDEKFLIVHCISGPRHGVVRNPRCPGKGLMNKQFSFIPLYMPIMIAVALNMADGSDAVFYRTMLDMKKDANNCPHDYTERLEDLSGVMEFEDQPTEQDYDYIKIKFLDAGKSNDNDSDDDDDDYAFELVDDDLVQNPPEKPEAKDEPYRIPLHLRLGPVVKEKDMSPEERLLALKQVYSADVLPEEYREEERLRIAKYDAARKKEAGRKKKKLKNLPPAPKLPARGEKSARRTPPPPGSQSQSSLDISTRTKRKPPPVPRKHFDPWDIRRHNAPKQPIQSVRPQMRSAQENVETVKDQLHIRELPGERSKPSTETLTMKFKQKSQRIQSISEIPEDICALTQPQLLDCMDLLMISDHKEAISRNVIDGELLQSLDESILQTDFGFSRLSAIKLVKFAKGWRPHIK